MDKYIKPELEITSFDTEDVITASILTGEDEMEIIKADSAV